MRFEEVGNDETFVRTKYKDVRGFMIWRKTGKSALWQGYLSQARMVSRHLTSWLGKRITPKPHEKVRRV